MKGAVAVITKQELDSAIAECQGKRDPDARTCMMLAAFYTIRNEMYGDAEKIEHPSYSYAPAPDRNPIDYDSDTEFARVISRMDMNDVLPVIDELMETLSIIQPRLYNAVLDKLA